MERTIIGCDFTNSRSKVAIGPLLISSQLSHRAYVEAQAIYHRQIYGQVDDGCDSFNWVFVDTGDNFFRLAVRLGPEKNDIFPSNRVTNLDSLPTSDGTGIRLLDWSANSRYLLLEVQEWLYGHDNWNIPTYLLRYDVTTGLAQAVDLMDLVEKHAGKGKVCEDHVKTLGFTSDGSIVFQSFHYFNPSYEPTFCFPGTRYWRLDLSNNKIDELAEKPKIVFNSTVSTPKRASTVKSRIH